MRTSIVHHALRALLVGVVAALTGDAVTLADEPPTAVEASIMRSKYRREC